MGGGNGDDLVGDSAAAVKVMFRVALAVFSESLLSCHWLACPSLTVFLEQISNCPKQMYF